MKGGWVYIMTNRPNGTLYTGVTSDIVRRACMLRSPADKKMLAWRNLMRLCLLAMIGLLCWTGGARGDDAAGVSFQQTKSGTIAYLRSIASEEDGLFVGACRQTDTHIGVTAIYVVMPRGVKEAYVVEINDVSEGAWVNMASTHLHGSEVELLDMTSGGESTADIIVKAARSILVHPMRYMTSVDAALNFVPTYVCPKF